MPFPSQTFTTIGQLINYINDFIIPNGVGEIDGSEHNNVENGLAHFIVSYTLNNALASIVTAGGVVTLPAPITVITGTPPSSIQWNDNVQNEYYVINTTGVDIPLTTGFSYIDANQVVKTIFPARTAIHIAKMSNAGWLQVNNLGGSGGITSWDDITGKPQTYQFVWVVGGTSNFGLLPGSPPPSPPGVGAPLVTSLIEGFPVRVSRGGLWQMSFDPLDGDTYYTKVDNASNTVTFFPPTAFGEKMIVETIPL